MNKALSLRSRSDHCSGVLMQSPRRPMNSSPGPTTVAFGYYDPTKPGVLRIQSGDVVEVTTMLTSSPTRLQLMGLPAAEVQPELSAIYDEVTDRGPGGHILTGPIHVDGARPGDVLEVRSPVRRLLD